MCIRDRFTSLQVKDIALNVECPVLHFYGDWDFREMRKKSLEEVAPLFQNIEIKKVSGDHYFHIHNISEIKEDIKKFLLKVL